MKRRRRKGRLVLPTVLVIIILVCIVILSAEVRLRPIVRDIALSRAKSIATRAINDTINSEMEANAHEYADIVYFEKDGTGGIIAAKLDITKINKLKARVVSAVAERLRITGDMTVKIPLGNVINGEIFSGRGPKISVKLVPTGSVNASFYSEFTSAGINQTRHRILINTSVYISVILPAGAAGTEVMSEVAISETILVGKVPESYTNIEDVEDELLEKINNYT
ncbi:MAG: sporulation protein YunB [Clostridia bacterium]|nr:sporulation protein YunB [Clostridia bacterium]